MYVETVAIFFSMTVIKNDRPQRRYSDNEVKHKATKWLAFQRFLL